MRITFSLVWGTLVLAACSNNSDNKATPENNITASRDMEHDDLVKRGEYIVLTNVCHDCHSPKVMTPKGPVPDSTKLLSGHPANTSIPTFSSNVTQPGQWLAMSPDITAFAGPWGISYAANLTPDSATGIGAWTEEQFVNTLRKGKHLGADNGRDILPPMPWQFFAKMTDDDLNAIYTYLKTIPSISNRVPAPTPPNEVKISKP
ncbi:c-type cytochrome [Flavisolibacter tropicus]|uniref:Cytochrome c domain-containing protein n=1 Tax=Flavisolibacter tropicus TaxID=1492898 RepID=A0A172U088_9BACT|nr:c-type cytochrome [Flavisolibacter tropicus]ANE52730.1 hypothetical protein SY85_21895 [Flavisolibacter tropicus]